MLAQWRERLRRIIDNCECYHRKKSSLTRFCYSYNYKCWIERQTHRHTGCGDPWGNLYNIGVVYNKIKKHRERERGREWEREREREREII